MFGTIPVQLILPTIFLARNLHRLALPQLADALRLGTIGSFCYLSDTRSGGGIVPHLQLVLLGNVLRLPQDAPVTSRLPQVLVAPPQDVAQFVVRQGYAIKSLKSYLVQHPQEQFLDFPPPAGTEVIKVGVLGQRGQVFFRGKPGIPAILLRQCHNLPAHFHIGIIKHIVKERVEVFPEESAQAIVGHCFVQQGLFGIESARMVGYHDGYLSRCRVEEAFGLGPSALQGGCVRHDFHVVQVQFPGQFLYPVGHIAAFTFGKGASLVGRAGGLAKEFRDGVVGSSEVCIGQCPGTIPVSLVTFFFILLRLLLQLLLQVGHFLFGFLQLLLASPRRVHRLSEAFNLLLLCLYVGFGVRKVILNGIQLMVNA